MLKLVIAVLLGMLVWPVAAQETGKAAGEIIYRVNLGRADDVALLLKQGISADQKDEKGTPLLALAAARDDEEGLNILKTLLAAGADINAKDTAGQSALFYAARRGNKEAVQYLLENKINYYAVDNQGDIARTIAFRAGHNEIVTQLDNFVRGESEKIAEQYRALSQALEEQYKSQATEQKNAEEATNAALEKSRAQDERWKEQQVKADEPKGTEVTAADKAQYDLAFHACAFQYWSFCNDSKQTSELTGDALDKAIATHLQQINTQRSLIINIYKKNGQAYADKVISAAQQSVFNQLIAMPSRTYRFEHGVGKMEDLAKRCQEISKYPTHVTTLAPQPPAKPGRDTKRLRKP